MIPLMTREPEQPLLQDGVTLVPERGCEAETALPVGDAKQSVLTPPVCATARLIVREVAQPITVGRVVFTRGHPWPLREVWAPSLPVSFAARVLAQAALLGIVRPGHGGKLRTPIRVSSTRRTDKGQTPR